ncbi:MAG: DUF4364 family protein [Clostridia bacterium]|nr:DUF4364 family protein [Clostridia bacterium]
MLLYTREISDPVLIQYIILFTMSEADRTVTHNQLTSLVLDRCNISFTDFSIALDNLINIGLVARYKPEPNIHIYELTEKGIEANGFFYRSIPIYIREQIVAYIAPFFREEIKKSSTRAEIIPINEQEFMVQCGIYDNKTPLMELNFYAGTRKTAAQMVRHFKEKQDEIYQTILYAMSPAEENASE